MEIYIIPAIAVAKQIKKLNSGIPSSLGVSNHICFHYKETRREAGIFANEVSDSLDEHGGSCISYDLE